MNLSDLTPDPNNANKGIERGNRALEASLQQYGAGRSILLDKNDTIIAGNKTAEMAGQLGMMNVKVVETTGDELVAVKRTDLDLETDATAREMAYADNRVGELSLDWDADALLNDIENGIDVSKFFSDNEIDKLLGPKPTEDVPAPDATAELQEKWGTERGQVWTIGRHRLMCGDALKDVGILMDGKKAGMVFMDPPYNVNYGNHGHPTWGTHRKIENDFQESKDWFEFCAGVASVVKVITDGCVYVCHAPGPDGRVMAAALDGKLHWSSTVVWVKDRLVLGRGKYHNRYEPIWFGWVVSGATFTEDRTLDNVWEFPRPTVSDMHPTMKPIDLVERAISHNLDGESVGDLFLGSGTTMVAAEQLNRTCYGMEIDPGYCAVILERMSGMGLEGTIAV